MEENANSSSFGLHRKVLEKENVVTMGLEPMANGLLDQRSTD